MVVEQDIGRPLRETVEHPFCHPVLQRKLYEHASFKCKKVPACCDQQLALRMSFHIGFSPLDRPRPWAKNQQALYTNWVSRLTVLKARHAPNAMLQQGLPPMLRRAPKPWMPAKTHSQRCKATAAQAKCLREHVAHDHTNMSRPTRLQLYSLLRPQNWVERYTHRKKIHVMLQNPDLIRLPLPLPRLPAPHCDHSHSTIARSILSSRNTVLAYC